VDRTGDLGLCIRPCDDTSKVGCSHQEEDIKTKKWKKPTRSQITFAEMEQLDDEELGFAMVDVAGAQLRALGIDEWADDYCEQSNALAIEYRTIFFPSILEGEVLNGGFEQYFTNHRGTHNAQTLDALNTLGAEGFTRVFERALAVFERERALFLCDDLEDAAQIAVRKERLKDLGDLDSAFYRLENVDPIVCVLGRYARAHAAGYCTGASRSPTDSSG
jgi:hypothetical protein